MLAKHYKQKEGKKLQLARTYHQNFDDCNETSHNFITLFISDSHNVGIKLCFKEPDDICDEK